MALRIEDGARPSTFAKSQLNVKAISSQVFLEVRRAFFQFAVSNVFYSFDVRSAFDVHDRLLGPAYKLRGLAALAETIVDVDLASIDRPLSDCFWLIFRFFFSGLSTSRPPGGSGS